MTLARYAWTLDYDPQAAGGNGRFVFTLHGERPKPEEVLTADLPASHREEALKRLPVTTTFSVDLPPGYREQGATFDHFGLMNMTKPGGQTSIYFDDLRYNDRAEDFARDPEWYGQGNRPAIRQRMSAVHIISASATRAMRVASRARSAAFFGAAIIGDTMPTKSGG